jgi:hypothetical protein
MFINFRRLKKKNILILGESFLTDFIKNEKYEYEYVYYDKKSVNFLILLKIFFSNPLIIFNNLSVNQVYFTKVVEDVDPKLIITYHDNNINFYKLKKNFPNKKFIAIQNGYRFKKNDIFEKLEIKEDLSCDYVFCFGNAVAKLYRSMIKTKTICHGSLKNNIVKIKKEKKNLLVFISAYGLGNNNSELKIIPILLEYCFKNNLKFLIINRTSAKKELDFYLSIKGILKKNIIERKNYSYTNALLSYKIIDTAKISVCLNSTLGYENLSRGNKTLFINTKDRNLNCSSFLSYGWPIKFKKNGPLWLGKINRSNIFYKLDNILKLNSFKWKKISTKYTKNIINYEYNNISLLKLINKYS